MSLFRDQAIQNQRKRLYGEVTIHQPASLMAFTILIVAGTVAAGVWLATQRYARKELVSGWIAPREGLAQVYAPRGGVATRVLVKVGDRVTAGAPMASFSLDVSGTGGSLVAQQRTQTQARIAEIDVQLAQSRLHNTLEGDRQHDRVGALREEAEQLREELNLARQQLVIAEKQLTDMDTLIAKGYGSVLERERRAQAIIAQKQAIIDLGRQLAAKTAEAGDAAAEAKAMPAGGAVETSSLRATRAGLVQTLDELSVQETVVVHAPIAGLVAAANLNVGDSVTSTSPLFAIAPTSGPLQAELLSPGKAIGFIAVGQPVRLRLDAFPSERFGTMDATIATVSRAPVNPGQIVTPIDFKEPVYRLEARLAGRALWAYGHTLDLRPGMTFKAYVITSRRTFLEWLIDPILAAQGASR